jgi:hypothetical protein
MRVRIISYEDVNGWILGKFAKRLHDELTKLGIKAEISNTPDNTADINHHIIYLDYDLNEPATIDTLMITHIDNQSKLALIKNQLQHAKMGICMSAETMNLLVEFGVPPEKVCYIKPAHDGVITKKKHTIGIACKVHEDGRKREQFLVKLADKISAADFRFKIMGEGWNGVADILSAKGFDIEYFPSFNYDGYIKMIPELDYYLYMGQDEGSMGFIDALAAGVKTIVTPQGYHLDAPGGLTHPFTTFEELESVFKEIAAQRNKLVNAVSDWTWEHYAIKHLQVWKYLLTGEITTNAYEDGLNSVLKKEGAQAGFWSRMRVQYKILVITGSRFWNSTDKAGKIKRKLKF